jgi:di/tricarboxylate transporter
MRLLIYVIHQFIANSTAIAVILAPIFMRVNSSGNPEVLRACSSWIPHLDASLGIESYRLC